MIYGIRGNALEWLKDFLTDTQQVLVNGGLNNSQGTVLACLLHYYFHVS